MNEEARAVFECVDYISEYCSNHKCNEKCALFNAHEDECYLSSCGLCMLCHDKNFKEDKEKWIQKETN